MAHSSVNIPISPLVGTNYPTWKVQCKMALMKDGLWGVVSGTEVRPPDTEAAKLEKFSKLSDRALAIIVLAIDPSLLYVIGEPSNPVDVWKKLEDQFQRKTWANKLHLRKQLYSLRLENDGSMQEHIRAMTETFNALSVIGDAITEEDRVVHLLASLPESYAVLVTALEASPEVPSMEMVTERLLHEERKTKGAEHGHDSGVEKAMAVKWQKKKAPKCYRCGQIGHIKRDCPDGKHKKKSKTSHKVNSTQVDGESDSDGVGLLVCHALSASSRSSDRWVIDSGATSHMCNDKSLFKDFVHVEPPEDIALGDGHHLKTTGRGTVVLDLELSNGHAKKCTLTDVLYVPELSFSLVSIAKATGNVARTVFTSDGCRFQNADGKVVATGTKVGELYYLNCKRKQQSANVTQDSESSQEELWHRRYGHLGTRNLKKLVQEDLVTGLSCAMTEDIGVCEPCAKGKLHRTKFPTDGGRRSKSVLGLVHSDVCGKMSTQSLGGGEYFLTFIDDKTRYTWVYVLKHKHQVFAKFLEWKAAAENSTGQKLCVLRTDGGGEYTSREFQDYLREQGIRHETTVPKTPEQNGVAERMNRTVVETARCMLAEAELPRTFWAEAVSTAVYLRNRSPTSAVDGMTPYEALTGEKPVVSNLRVFGCLVYAHIPKDERQKFDSKARRCVFLGYGTTTKAYRLFDIERRRVFHSRDVIFDESRPGIRKDATTDAPLRQLSNDVDAADSDVESQEETAAHPEEAVGRPSREKRQPDRYGEWMYLSRDNDSDPTTVCEALASPAKPKWQAAMNKELESLRENDVWELTELPAGARAVGCKWVFKRKLGVDGSVERYKARLVAQGYTQKHGLDYDETFSPVVRSESVRALIAAAAASNMLLHQMDIVTAFLNGTLDEEVYMKQPDGYVTTGQEHLVCKLKKSLYGLKQSSRCWNGTLHNHLIQIGFSQSVNDPCVYTCDDGSAILAVYVDDILVAAKNMRRMNEVKQAIAERFVVKDLGALKHFLGMSIIQKPDAVWLGQSAYTKRVLDRYNMSEAKPAMTPVDTSVKLTKSDDNDEPVNQELYQSAVGSLLFLSMWTRPDITYAVGNVAKFCAKPSKKHWEAVKRIMRYLKGTINLGLQYEKGNSEECIGYSDADWAGDVQDRKSTSGYMFQMSGTAVSWRSKKQSCVALSTAEAEYMALASAAQEAVWLKQLVEELTSKSAKPIVVHEDNQAAIKMTKNPQFHGRAKHIAIKYHFIREQVERGTVKLEYCPTEDMLADILTKGLTRDKFCKFRIMAGVKTMPNK